MGGIINALAHPYEMGLHYEGIKQANKYDLWRRELGFDTFDALLASFEDVAKLTGEPVNQVVHQEFENWRKK
jgi:hypothetical protein